jgi:hypothetical protein
MMIKQTLAILIISFFALNFNAQKVTIIDSSYISNYNQSFENYDSIKGIRTIQYSIGGVNFTHVGRISHYEKLKTTDFGVILKHPTKSAVGSGQNSLSAINRDSLNEIKSHLMFYSNGKLGLIGFTINDKSEGYVAYFNKRGRLDYVEYFHNDNLVFRIEKIKKYKDINFLDILTNYIDGDIILEP